MDRIPRRALRALANNALLVSIALLAAGFTTLEESFLTLRNIVALLDQSAVFAVLAVGATFGIISRNIDIAPASVIALGTVVVALVVHSGHGFALGILAGGAATIAIYLAHGALVGWLDLDPLIVTLAAWIWARGLAISLTNASTISLNHPFVALMNSQLVFGLTPSTICAALVFIAGAIVLHHTRIGMNVFALGQDSKLLRQAGVDPAVAKLAIFATMGVFTAIGMVLMIARIGAAAPTAGFGLELDAIVAVIIGGSSFQGGSGRMLNTLYGVAFIAMLDNGLTGLQMGDPEFLLVKGFAILGALLLEVGGRRMLPQGPHDWRMR
jgi:ribose/xylose/arabinose/galactoside ABC-type transport system permease subunit